jgi:hypothetical protein
MTGRARIFVAAALAVGLVFPWVRDMDASAAGPLVGPTAEGGFALVELFTSEGCSSCPPADRVLAAIDREASAKGAPVFMLAWHVDYWDRLGWKDRFSSASWTERQTRYSVDRGLYTPQMVVNGTAQFVGSDRARASEAVRAALAQSSRARITVLQRPAATKEGLGVSVSAEQVPPENAGRTLQHVHAVRAHASGTAGYSKKRALTLRPPADLDHKRARLVAWAQDEAGRVLAATSAGLTPQR